MGEFEGCWRMDALFFRQMRYGVLDGLLVEYYEPKDTRDTQFVAIIVVVPVVTSTRNRLRFSWRDKDQ
jgi:hypothetical protein